MTDDERDQLNKLDEAVETIDRAFVELGALAADESAPRTVRRDAALALVSLRDQLRRSAPSAVETLIRIAYGDPHPDRTDPVSLEDRGHAARELVERGITTQRELDTLSMDELIARTRERLANQGVVDDTGQAG